MSVLRDLRFGPRRSPPPTPCDLFLQRYGPEILQMSEPKMNQSPAVERTEVNEPQHTWWLGPDSVRCVTCRVEVLHGRPEDWRAMNWRCPGPPVPPAKPVGGRSPLSGLGGSPWVTLPTIYGTHVMNAGRTYSIRAEPADLPRQTCWLCEKDGPEVKINASENVVRSFLLLARYVWEVRE